MAVEELLSFVPAILHANGNMWTSYDKEADVLYINFKKPSEEATDSELTDHDVILRYSGEELIGMTVLHASQRD